jgi:hypothetical protein
MGITAYDMVVDGSDNFETRYLLADTCEALEIPLVTAAVGRFDGIGDGACALSGRMPRASPARLPGPVSGSRRRRGWCHPAPKPA